MNNPAEASSGRIEPIAQLYARVLTLLHINFCHRSANLRYMAALQEPVVTDVLFFGKMADIVGSRSLRLDVGGEYLFTVRNRLFADALAAGRVRSSDIRMSVNRQVVTGDMALNANDEVAFFSVFSGG